ncbi:MULTISPECIES: GEVED domain-containing protein [Chryseobacterium]|uniref:T9SS type A sorting domain-containing protein n=1 Tax=Chryseobacterium candidae TaxID=1978493 RepID=A0ABY2RBV1_9FLAO|nr:MULTISPECIES: GEVED domain-containing protein [Chryseobacterium]PXW17091.1 putative secreted protein (Por secretion system target) [Chryseobacterium sp. CBTAP 102]THV63080.1 T9SS type A sorting domain-containing protein [Chryseobacterium candidae]
MKSFLISGLLLSYALLNAQAVCTANLGGGLEPSFVTFRINGTDLNHNTYDEPTVYYHEYPSNGNTTAQLTAGQSYDVFTFTSSEAVIGVWIDYNRNSIFEQNEFTLLVNSMNSQNTHTLSIPNNIPSGNIRMRVRSRAYGSSISAADACSSFGSGETRDYIMNVINNNLSVKETSRINNIQYYPNPTKNSVNIWSDQSITEYEIYSSLGGIVLKQSTIKDKNISIDLSSLCEGIYFVKLKFKEGFEVIKITKQ